MDERKHFEELRTLFAAAVERVDPKAMMAGRISIAGSRLLVATETESIELDLDRFDTILVLGAGKASAKMASGLVEILGGRITTGLVAVKDAHHENLGPIETIVAGHPVPDASSVDAARRLRLLAEGADERTLVLGVISGGGSALLCAPYEDATLKLTLEEKQGVTKALLACGATIHEINCVRKHLSGLKGGRLAQTLYPATSINLVLSDVVGDNLDAIASGLIVPDETTYADALEVIRRFGIESQLPDRAMRLLLEGSGGRRPETPKPGDRVFGPVRNVLLGTNAQALSAAAAKARSLGYSTVVLSSQITGEAREAARFYLGIGKDISKRSLLAKAPACVIAGGETTVTLRGDGKGGRNQEMALSFLREMEKQPSDTQGLYFLSAGTDGSDGPTDAAGAFASRELLGRAEAAGLSLEDFLQRNDSYEFFSRVDGLLRSGPTDTNVCDIQILLVP
ncbi:MAG TPA: glycerate kinase [Spirochaetia bacterium]|nr:glycerate kinase [Spirochaetia bacterium]